MYPRVNFDIKAYLNNYDYLTNKLSYLDEIFVVTKGYSAYYEIVDKLYEHGNRLFADSRVVNIKDIKTRYPDTTTLLLRVPMISEVDEIVLYANRSLNSELSTIEALSKACEKHNTTHDIILMVDVGDLREGIMYNSDYISFVKQVLTYKNINLIGLAFNVTCYGSVIPTNDTLQLLVDIRDDIENKLNIKIPIVSGGNSSTTYLGLDKPLPKGINNMRIGDNFLTGTEASYGENIPNMNQNLIQLEAEIIELKEKPSYPIGKLGVNAFGQKVEYEDVGIHTRAILGIGRQDAAHDELIPIDKNVKILGCSSDHLIVELKTDEYKVGDTIKFSVKYGAILSLFTSKYVYKNIY